MTTKSRTFYVAIFSLLAAPLLAGCAQQEDEPLDLSLKLGIMVPLTGPLSALGNDMRDGALLAVKTINDARAGIRVQAFVEDDKTIGAADAPATFNRLTQQGVTAIAGPCCSGVTAAMLDLAVQNEVVIASPSATAPSLTQRDNKGFFWRVTATDEGQGKILARLVTSDGHQTVNMIVNNNDYGNGLEATFKSALLASVPPGAVVKTEKFDDGATSFTSQVTAACATPRPDAIVFLGYTDEAALVLREMQSQGCLGAVPVYMPEGAFDFTLAEKAGKDPNGKFLASGVKGTRPGANLSAYNALFRAEYQHTPTPYSPQTYDAVMYLALAAVSANSVEGKDIAAKLLGIANAPGTKVSIDDSQDFSRVTESLRKGDDIDYVGQAHDDEFSPKHEPTLGTYSYWLVDDKGEFQTVGEPQRP